MMRRVAIALALSMLAACAAVETAPPPEPKKIETIDEYLAHQDYIRAGLLDGSLGELGERELEEMAASVPNVRQVVNEIEVAERQARNEDDDTLP